MQPNLVDPVAVEITDERFVSWVSKDEQEVSRAETAAILTEFVDDIKRLVRRPIDRSCVTAVTIEIPSHRDIPRVTREERDVCNARSQNLLALQQNLHLRRPQQSRRKGRQNEATEFESPSHDPV
jgi:hypothetical protein